MSVLWIPAGTLIEGARTYGRGERASITQVFTGKHSTCVSSLPWPGTLGSGDFAKYRVVNSGVAPVAGDAGKLTIQWEPAEAITGATLPQALHRGSPKSVPGHIIRHPKYAALRTWAFCSQLLIFEDSTDEATRTAARAAMITIGNGIATGLGTDFVANRCDGGLQMADVTVISYEVESHSWAFPALTLGVFYGTTGPTLPDSGSWPEGAEFRRLADAWAYNGSYYTLTSVWECGPPGIFDPLST